MPLCTISSKDHTWLLRETPSGLAITHVTVCTNITIPIDFETLQAFADKAALASINRMVAEQNTRAVRIPILVPERSADVVALRDRRS